MYIVYSVCIFAVNFCLYIYNKNILSLKKLPFALPSECSNLKVVKLKFCIFRCVCNQFLIDYYKKVKLYKMFLLRFILKLL